MIKFKDNKEIFELKLEYGKKLVESYGSMFPIIFPTVEGNDGKLYVIDKPLMLYYQSENEFIRVCKTAGGYCKQKNADGFLLIMSSKTRKMEKISKEQLEYFLENYETERPSMYPQSMIQEYLSVIYFDLQTEKILNFMCEYKKTEEEVIVFLQSECIDNVVFVIPSINFIKDGYQENYKDSSVRLEGSETNSENVESEDEDNDGFEIEEDFEVSDTDYYKYIDEYKDSDNFVQPNNDDSFDDINDDDFKDFID